MVSRQRIIDHGEVYTPPKLVNDMLDLVRHECERIDSRFLEPACGNGNFLAEVLRRKLNTVDRQHPKNRQRWERDALLSVCSVYGIDLLPDNVAECRERLLGIVAAAFEERFGEALSDVMHTTIAFVLSLNIIHGNALTFRTGDDQAIVFSEWSAVNSVLIKRRDYRFDDLLEQAEYARSPLFSDLGDKVYLPEHVGERPACHYLKIAESDA